MTWLRDYQEPFSIDIPNHWSVETVKETLEGLPSPYDSWNSLEEHARAVLKWLIIANDAFASLEGQPYAQGAAERIQILLGILDKMCQCIDGEGNRTKEYHRLYGDYFKGSKAWFSDSSDTEKHEFKSDLTFPHPEQSGEYIFCTWHGKVKTPQLRVHFSWPNKAGTPLYVLYVGPKITKR